MPLIIGAKSAAAEAHTVDNSCRFNSADSSQLQVTNGTATDNQKWTCSFWIKVGRGAVGVAGCLMAAKSGSPYFYLYIDDVYRINFYGQDKDGSNDVSYVTNRLFRDPSAWYHIVAAMDSTLAAAGDRFRIYVNGVEETSFSTETDPTQNKIYPINYTGFAVNVASRDDDVNPYDGHMAEVCLIDGQQLTPSSFGEFDSSSPTIWKPKDPSELTFGNNGFYLDFEDSADLGADASGNSNDFTATNLAAINQTTDTPTNNFCTFNPLAPSSVGQNLENGNLYCPGPNSPNYWQSVPSTLGARAGKWYWEFKDENSWGDTSNDTRRYGICDLDTIVQTLSSGADVSFSGSTSGYAYMNVSGVRYNGGTISGTDANYPTFEPGDILMCAMDLDNQKLYFGKNGTWLDSSDPTSGATGTGSVADISATATWSPYVETHYGSDNVSVNFGNPIAAPSSGNADGNGYGNFEYAPPSGYLALCTKNLGSDGG